MLKGINYWSFPGGLEGELPVREAITLAASHGFEALELCIEREGQLHLGTSTAELEAVRAFAEANGVKLASTASKIYWDRSLGDSSEANRVGARQDLEAMIRVTAALGASTLLTIPGIVDSFFMPDRPTEAYGDVQARAAEGLAALLPTAERHGVRLGIENVWSKFLLSPVEMAAFIDGFDSPWVGAYVDVANMLLYGYPQHWITLLGSRVIGVHFKDFRRAVGTAEGFVDLLEGDVPWPEVVSALKAVEYRGPVVAEMMPLYRHYPLVRIANTSRAMDAILGGQV